MYNINWPETYSMFTVIGTITMAIAVLFTACVARKTLIEKQDIKRENLSTKLLDIWLRDKYSEKVEKIRGFYNVKSEDLKEYYKKETKIPIDFTPFDDKFMKVLATMISVKNFVFKLNYYLSRKKLVLENIDIDLSSRLILNTEKSMKKFYEVLRWGYEYINFSSLITSEDIKILNNFYIKVSEYKKYKNLIDYIKEDNRKLNNQ